MKDLIGTLEEGTNAEKAALMYLESHPGRVKYYHTITEVFDALKGKKIQKGIIPLLNKASGYCKETSENMGRSRVIIEQDITIPARQYLCCLNETKKENISEIMSHPQAIMQCRNYIGKNYKDCRLISTKNTAYAIKQISEKKMKNSAAIGPKHTIKKYGLKVISRDISDKKENSTLFAVVSLA